jgi:hypothetical protein
MTDNSALTVRRFLSRRLTSLAVAAAVLVVTGFVAAFLAWLLLGGGVWRSEVSVVGARLHSPTKLVLVVDSCYGDPKLSQLQETDRDVQVKVVASSTPFRGRQDCADGVEVQLQEPLVGRVVVDKHTGQSVSVTKVNSLSH